MKKIEIYITQEEIRNLASLNNGYGLKILDVYENETVKIIDPIITFNKISGFLTDKDYLILTKTGDLFSTIYYDLENCNEPMIFNQIYSNQIVEDVYLTCGRNNPDYEGDAILTFKILKKKIIKNANSNKTRKR